ncbi:MAG: NADH:ubiquinone oxidoreductase subunit 2, partial [Mariprofundales bacterium]|nr:NADH:ubiquinone oxidoreductase subunit 2 [Mariprofundales bacterium]
VEAGHITLALLALLFSAIGAFYYLRVVKYIYFDDAKSTFTFADNSSLQVVVTVATIMVVALGLFPGPLMEICHQALIGLV